MPVYLRNFYIKKLVDIKNLEEKETKKARNKGPSRFKAPSTPKSKFRR